MAATRILWLLLLMSLQVTFIYTTLLPNTFRCFLWDTSCVTALAQTIKPRYIQDTPELSAIKLDPLNIDYLRIQEGGFDLKIQDAKVTGLKDMVIEELSANSNISLGYVRFRTDLFVTGLYNIDGSLLFVPINGVGDYCVTIKNLEVDIFAPFKIFKNINGLDFINATNYTFRYEVKDSAQFELNNLYNGNSLKSELMHNLINLNSKFIMSKYARTFMSTIVDRMAKAYKIYFQAEPLESLVEY